jgi:hypothetical protein
MIDENAEAPSGETGDPTFISTLKEGHQRFLAHAIEHSFVCGRRSAEDFIRHFPATAIMKGLEHQPTLRAGILVLTTGLKQKIALKKGWEDAATDLQIALDEGETDADSIVALFNADDRVRYLPADKIWSFLIEGEFWKASSLNKSQGDVARNHVAFMLERGLEDKLLTHRDVVGVWFWTNEKYHNIRPHPACRMVNEARTVYVIPLANLLHHPASRCTSETLSREKHDVTEPWHARGLAAYFSKETKHDGD